MAPPDPRRAALVEALAADDVTPIEDPAEATDGNAPHGQNDDGDEFGE